MVHSVQYKGSHVGITSLQYSCHGEYLAIGFGTGHVEILDAVTLHVEGLMSGNKESEARFNYSNDSIKQMVFSHDNSYLACTVSSAIYSLGSKLFLPLNKLVFKWQKCFLNVWEEGYSPGTRTRLLSKYAKYILKYKTYVLKDTCHVFSLLYVGNSSTNQ